MFVLDGFLAVGSYRPKHVNAELFDFETDAWTTVSDYPYADGLAIRRYEILFIPEMSAFIVISGKDDDSYVATIGMFCNNVWSDVGRLNTARAVILTYFLFQNY